MRKMFSFARSNLRRNKSQTAAMAVLILIASMMLNLWLMLSMDCKRNFERYHAKLNAEHVTLAINSSDAELKDFVKKVLEADERTKEYYIDEAMFAVGSFNYGGGEVVNSFIIMKKDAAISRPVGRLEIVEQCGLTSGVYLPMLYGMKGDYSAGEKIEINFGETAVSYDICGFLNSVMTGSHNCAICALMLTEDKYKELKETGLTYTGSLVSVRINDSGESEDFEAMLKNEISLRYPDIGMSSNSYATVSTSRYISQMICSGIVSAMAFFVTLIALVVIASNVINYVQENMKNLGVLKAVGYRSRQIIYALMFQFLSITLIDAVVGIGLSYCLFPSVNTMMISQTGIPYKVRFLPLPFLITLGCIGGTVALAVWLSARRIAKIEPIVALRQGILTHSFKRNYFPLEKTRIAIQPALALKSTFRGVKQNITVCITMLVLSLVITFSGLMIENVILNKKPFVDLIIGETSDAVFSVNTDIEEEVLRRLENDEQVEKLYLYSSCEVRHVGGIALWATMCDDFSKANNQNICVEGRYPKYDNEIAIAAKYARENNLKIGQEITMTAEGGREKYIISGFTQISNNLGKDCLFTRGGYERMGNMKSVNYNINLKEGTDIDEFIERIKEQYNTDIDEVFNMNTIIEGTASVYISLMVIIVIAVAALSMAIIIFVLYLLVRTMLNTKKQDYGIMKALGFTTGQLILQTALSFMPAVIFSVTAGLIISSLIINPLTALFLRGIGIVRCNFNVPAVFIASAGIMLVLFTFAAACLLSLKIRKISPRELFSGE